MWLYLFDVDGTLVHSGGAGRRAIETAFTSIWGRTLPGEEYRKVRFNGRSDMAILRDVGALIGLGADEYLAREAELLAVYLEVLPDEVAESPGKRQYPGVRELLQSLEMESRVRVGLLTGNLEAAARAKLAPFDLNRFFPTGGFGSDAVDRREIAVIARRRAEEHYAERFAPSRVVVVGDTPADVDCARAGGFHAVVVGTGMDSEETLRATNPDLYFADFGDTRAVLDALFTRFPPEPGVARPA